jgi:hypothetical protein
MSVGPIGQEKAMHPYFRTVNSYWATLGHPGRPSRSDDIVEHPTCLDAGAGNPGQRSSSQGSSRKEGRSRAQPVGGGGRPSSMGTKATR